MIKTFADKETEKIYSQRFSKKLPQSIQRIALRKLIMIDNAQNLEDLRIPPANHLERLEGIVQDSTALELMSNIGYVLKQMEIIFIMLRS